MTWITDLIRETDPFTWLIISGVFVLAVRFFIEIHLSAKDDYPG